jgi:Putative zinc-finger
MYDESKPEMRCTEFEALLTEALDGTLHGTRLAEFEAHQRSCDACAALSSGAAAGMHWLKGLEDVEPPKNLVHNILAQTIGSIPETSARPLPTGEGWIDKLRARVAPMFAPLMTPRFAMSFGMAFFSITMLANVIGVRASDLKHVDITAKGLQKTYYSTQARVVRYYENIRLVYEIESRVRDLRRAATPDQKQEDTTPKKHSREGSQKQKYQNYGTEPVLAHSGAVEQFENSQARLNRRTV